MLKKKKGVTLIELIITLGLSTIILGSIYFFYFSNSNSINETQYKSDLQADGEVIIKKLSKTLIQAKGITEIKDTTNTSVLDASSCDISYVKIKLQSGASSFSNVEYTLASKTLTEKIDVNNVTIGDYVKSINLETLDGKKFSECKGIKVTITLAKQLANKEITYQIKSDIVFRNADSKP